MEGILSIFTFMGGISLYLVIMSLVTNFIYSSFKNGSKDDKMILAILGGVFFPVTIPVGIFIYWIYVFVSIPINKIDEDKDEKKNQNGSEKSKERKGNDSKFKVNDIITGVKGNPGRYIKFYEGCVCRVLELRRYGEIKVILISHKDIEAQKENIGYISTVPEKYFKLVKEPVTKKKK